MSSKRDKTITMINESLPELQRIYRQTRYLENIVRRRDFWLFKLLFVLNNRPIGYDILGKKARVFFSDGLATAFKIRTTREESVDQYESLFTSFEEYATSTTNMAEEFARASFGLARLYKEVNGRELNYKGIGDPIWGPYREAVGRSKEAESLFRKEWSKWEVLLKHT